MKVNLPIVLLCILQNIFGEEIPPGELSTADELSHLEQTSMNLSCDHWDSCMEGRENDPPVPNIEYHCSCHRQCWEFGTCCINSPYKVKPPIQKCRRAGIANQTDLYYMVDRCPDNTSTDSFWKNQCEKEWNEEDDILMLSPVTSLDTSRTYKNYYCFKCHETTTNYVSWNFSVDSYNSVSGKTNVFNVSYNQEQKSWMAKLDEKDVSFPVNLSFKFPPNLQAKPFPCDLDMIADCPGTWDDRRVREKCLSYTAAVYKDSSSYKNIHCALCNSVPLEALSCMSSPVNRNTAIKQSPVNINTGIKKNGFQSHRSIIEVLKSHLIGDGEMGDNDCSIWNPYTKECVEIFCLTPGHVIKNDRCVLP